MALGAAGWAWHAGYLDRAHCRDWRFWREEAESKDLVLHGNIDVRQVNLAFKVEGRIDTVAVDEGEAVEPGSVMATLDHRYFDDDLRLARARRDVQTATLARLRSGSRPEEIAEARAMVDQRKAEADRLRSTWIGSPSCCLGAR